MHPESNYAQRLVVLLNNGKNIALANNDVFFAVKLDSVSYTHLTLPTSDLV